MNTTKRIFTAVLLALWCLVSAHAGRQLTDSAYSLSFHAGYGYNRTYGSMGVFDVQAFMPVNTHFEMQADVRLATANTYACGVQLRPKFPLPVGELFLEDRLLMGLYTRSHTNEMVQQLSLGYRMQYVSVQLGMGTRLTIPQPYEWHSMDQIILDPFTICYRVEAFVRPATSPWNISLLATNITDCQMERSYQPLFAVGGWYSVDEHWRVHLDAMCKPTGMFHLNATYYGTEVRAGFEYRF